MSLDTQPNHAFVIQYLLMGGTFVQAMHAEIMLKKFQDVLEMPSYLA